MNETASDAIRQSSPGEATRRSGATRILASAAAVLLVAGRTGMTGSTTARQGGSDRGGGMERDSNGGSY